MDKRGKSKFARYNVETNLWQEIRASGRAPPARSGAQAVVWNGNVWFFGGYTKKEWLCGGGLPLILGSRWVAKAARETNLGLRSPISAATCFCAA